jgi:hypothetical protein
LSQEELEIKKTQSIRKAKDGIAGVLEMQVESTKVGNFVKQKTMIKERIALTATKSKDKTPSLDKVEET